MKQIARHLQQVAARHFQSVLPDSPAAHGHFKALITAEISGEIKPLLLVGSAHRHFDDGYCMAILNPEPAVVDQILPGCAYSTSILRHQVSKRCDAAINVVFTSGPKKDGVIVGSYISRAPAPARFCVT